MTSKEALSYLLGEALYNIETSNKVRECYAIIEKELEVLEAIKDLLNDAVLWLEIEHEMVENKEHKKKKQLIKEWLEDD